jgi:hypothetical protein
MFFCEVDVDCLALEINNWIPQFRIMDVTHRPCSSDTTIFFDPSMLLSVTSFLFMQSSLMVGIGGIKAVVGGFEVDIGRKRKFVSHVLISNEHVTCIFKKS